MKNNGTCWAGQICLVLFEYGSSLVLYNHILDTGVMLFCVILNNLSEYIDLIDCVSGDGFSLMFYGHNLNMGMFHICM